MWKNSGRAILAAAMLCLAAHAQEGGAARDLFVTVGKSLVVDSPVIIQRVAIANPELAEALAVSPREVLVNGRAPGETSLIIWQQGGNRLIFDLNVRSSAAALEAVKRELAQELPGQEITVSMENNTAFVRGTSRTWSRPSGR
jgi:pilus assembly protein CpaC